MMRKEWKDSIGDEANAMIRNDTWYESELPKGKKAVTSRWFFTIKYLPNGQIDRRKTSLVARGYTRRMERITLIPLLLLPSFTQLG